MALPRELVIDGIRYKRMDSIADRVSTHAMYECHLFETLVANSVVKLIAEWQALNNDKRVVDKYGQTMLCPMIVLEGKKEIRRVGQMVFPDSKDYLQQLAAWRAACEADPDIPRLLAAR